MKSLFKTTSKTIFKTTLITLSLMLTLPAVAANPVVDVKTNMGDFTLELYPEKAPKTVENFLKYVKDGSYVGTQFHRVIAGFMAQGGGFDSSFVPSPTSYGEVINESKNGLANDQATIAMARTSNPDSATRQFYINLQNNANLNASGNKPGYTVFGKVINGFSTIQKMETVKTGSVPKTHFQDVPEKPIVIEKMALVKTTTNASK